VKTFIALVTAVVVAGGVVLGGLVYVTITDLETEVSRLEKKVEAESALDETTAAGADQSAKLAELESRLARIEEALLSGDAGDDATSGMDLSEVQIQLASHAKEIEEIRADLEGVRRARGMVDQAADRLLGEAQEDGTRRGGLERLSELGALFGRRSEDLTDEERARRDEITAQFQQRVSDWAVRAFDRSLEVKLTDDQKTSLGQFLAQERAALNELRGQELTDEQTTAARTDIRTRTDQQAAQVLSPEQYESWTTYRARSGNRRFGGFGRTR
jgi:hypothetical protein